MLKLLVTVLHVNHYLVVSIFERLSDVCSLIYFSIIDMLVGGHGESNPNTNWLDSRGLWISYAMGMLVLHLILLSVPVFSVAVAWTLTNIIHNLVS